MADPKVRNGSEKEKLRSIKRGLGRRTARSTTQGKVLPGGEPPRKMKLGFCREEKKNKKRQFELGNQRKTTQRQRGTAKKGKRPASFIKKKGSHNGRLWNGGKRSARTNT